MRAENMRNILGLFVFFASVIFLAGCRSSSTLAGKTHSRLADTVIVLDNNADQMERFAACEIRRYIYLVTGVRTKIVSQIPEQFPAIVVRTKSSTDSTNLSDQCFSLAILRKSPLVEAVEGFSPVSTLWAAYTLVESWGVGFYLGGDALLPVQPDKVFEGVERLYKPAFAIRGNLPWYNFQNSPTSWNLQDYETFFDQMAKQKANFIGFHAYDHEPFCAYSGNSAMPLMTTTSPYRWWSPPPMKTGDYLFGTEQFFFGDEWGCEVEIKRAWHDLPDWAVERQQAMLADALAYAHKRGLRTCLGFEVHGDPADPDIAKQVELRLRHTLATYPLDYVWIWQSEGYGIGDPQAKAEIDDDIRSAFDYLPAGHSLAEAQRITKFVRLAHTILKNTAPNVRLIVSGWGGDLHMKFTSLYPGLDKVVAKDVIFSALDNIDPGIRPNVSMAYGDVSQSRECWPIPWFESDAGQTRLDQTGPQTNVTPFEALLKDALAKGCQGILGIHWRTRNVEDVAGYLYRFAWEPELTAKEFFKRYARDHYGAQDAEEMAKIHLRLDQMGPQYVGAAGCVECSTAFNWFTYGFAQSWKPNRAAYLPDENRFPELEDISKWLGVLEDKSRREGRTHSATQFYDLRQIINWLVCRAKVGLAICNAEAPLGEKLRQAEDLKSAGKKEKAVKMAEEILLELESYSFRDGLQSLASTCRTRGELGMLATANARYGRFYSDFLSRMEAVLDKKLQDCRSAGNWFAKSNLIVYPVPNEVPQDHPVWFDAVLLTSKLPLRDFSVWLRNTDSHTTKKVSLTKVGRGYYRAIVSDLPAGEYYWRIRAELGDGAVFVFPGKCDPDRLIAIGAALGKVIPTINEPNDFARYRVVPEYLYVAPTATFELLGPDGDFSIEGIPDWLTVTPTRGSLPTAITVSTDSSYPREFTFAIKFQSQGAKSPLKVSGYAVKLDWDIKFYGWKPADAAKPPDWEKIVSQEPLASIKASKIDFEWEGAPYKNVPRDFFAVSASTDVRITAGKYKVAALSDDGVRVKIDGKIVIDNWTFHPSTTDTATVDIGDGYHQIAIEYFQAGGDAFLKFWIQPAKK